MPNSIQESLSFKNIPTTIRPLKFAVVDIETTGLFHQGHSITEIAVVHVDDGSVSEAFHSMVLPERFIPTEITQLTGISGEMVAQAPAFSEVLPGFLAAIEGRIMVAHHVNFDFQFLKANAEKYNQKIANKRLCTLKLARKVWPNEESYALGALCTRHGIINTAPHRAMGDAKAAAALLVKLRRDDADGHLEAMLGSSANNTILPAHLRSEQVESIPEHPGVYYFYGSENRPIYIGKAKNLKRRVLSHFSGAGSSRKKQLFQREIRSLTYTRTPSEYQAWLLEDAEIKKYWPKHNSAQKERTRSYAAVVYKSRSGLERIGIISCAHCSEALAWFVTPGSARSWLQKAALEYGWDPARAGLFVGSQSTLGLSHEAKSFQDFMSTARREASETYVLAEAAEGGIVPYVLIESGRYKGFGTSQDLRTFDRDHLRLAPESSTTRAIVRKMLTDDTVNLHYL